MSKAILLPIGFTAIAAAWFLQRQNAMAAEAVPQGGNASWGFLDGIMNAIRDTVSGSKNSAPAAPTPVTPQAPLPTNIPLSRAQVEGLAASIIQRHGFLCEFRELAVTAWIESSFRPWAKRDEKRANGTVWDTSYGLMQTLTGTAQDMYDKGYKAMGAPSVKTLVKPEVSMYFGAAYKDWLRRSYKGKSKEWYTRAYNGGAGWEKTQNGPANTAVYYQRFSQIHRDFYGANP